MDDVSQAILNAWAKIWPQLKADPHQLLRRLQRRQSASLQRPLRHYCIALRASDRRITPAHWVIFPRACHGPRLTRPIPTSPSSTKSLIQTYALQKFCRPVRFDPMGEEACRSRSKTRLSKSAASSVPPAGNLSETRRVSGLGGKPGKPSPHPPQPNAPSIPAARQLLRSPPTPSSAPSGNTSPTSSPIISSKPSSVFTRLLQKQPRAPLLHSCTWRLDRVFQ
jgi:hypothetical protein